jgi:hypothetical protein
MSAALSGADQVISLLLSRGADPDRTDQYGDTALIFAIQSGVLPTIETLAGVTNKKLGEALRCLAKDRVEVTPGILGLVQRAGRDRKAVMLGLKGACMYGAVDLLKALTSHLSTTELPTNMKQELFTLAVESDCPATCAAMMDLVSPIPQNSVGSSLYLVVSSLPPPQRVFQKSCERTSGQIKEFVKTSGRNGRRKTTKRRDN